MNRDWTVVLRVFKPANRARAAYLIATRLNSPGAFRDSFRSPDSFGSPKACVKFAFGLMDHNEILFASVGDQIRGFWALDDFDTRNYSARCHVHYWTPDRSAVKHCGLFLDVCRESYGLKILRIELPKQLKKPRRLVEYFGGVLVGEIPGYYGDLDGVIYYKAL